MNLVCESCGIERTWRSWRFENYFREFNKREDKVKKRIQKGGRGEPRREILNTIGYLGAWNAFRRPSIDSPAILERFNYERLS